MDCSRELEERLARASQNKREVEKEMWKQVELSARLNKQK